MGDSDATPHPPAGEWGRVEELFDEAFERPRHEREAWVRRVAPDPRIAEEVLALLRASDRPGLLDEPLAAAPSRGDDPDVIRKRLTSALDGAYRIGDVLGRGGMAIVFRAHETKHDRAVVLKVLRPEVARWVGASRFLAEIQIVARLSHPHIVSLIDSGQADGMLYFVMPFLGGETLRDRLARGPLPPGEALVVLRDMADALAYAHDNALVHRDLKPENILLVDDHAYLMDFGVAKLGRDAESLTSTVEGVAVGTPAYMAPEQAMGASVDARADVYAWGVVAREVLLGRYDPHATVDGLVSPALAALIRRAHTAEAAERPRDGAALVAALDAAAPSAAAFDTPERGVAHVAPNRTTRSNWRSSVVVGVVLAAVVVFAWRARQTPAPLPSLPAPVVVAPLLNDTGDSTLSVWGRLAGDWITQGLQETGRVSVVPWSVALPASRDAASGANGEFVSAFARETGAGTVVTGTFYPLGDRLRLEAAFLDVRTGVVLATVPAVEVPRDSIERGVTELRDRAMGFVAIRTDHRVGDEPGSAERPPTYEAYRLFERGLDAYYRLDYNEAVTTLVEAWRRDTLFLRPLVYAARAMWNIGGERGRVDSLVRELQRRPTGLTRYHQLQVRYLESRLAGDGVKALAAIQEASALAPGGRADYNVAMTAMSVGRPALAVETLRRLDPERGGMRGWAPYWYALSHALHLQGNRAEELAVVHEMQRRHPDSRPAWVHLVRVHAAAGDTAAIDSALAAASALPPDTYWSQGAMLVTAYEELHAHANGRGAARYFRRAVEWLGNQLARTPNHQAHRFWMAAVLYDNGDYDDAEPYVESLVADYPDNLQYRSMYALLAARAGDRERALQRLGAPPQYERGEYLSYQARVTAVLGDTEQAIALWSEALGRGRDGVVWIHAAARPDILPLMHDERFRRLGVIP